MNSMLNIIGLFTDGSIRRGEVSLHDMIHWHDILALTKETLRDMNNEGNLEITKILSSKREIVLSLETIPDDKVLFIICESVNSESSTNARSLLLVDEHGMELARKAVIPHQLQSVGELLCIVSILFDIDYSMIKDITTTAGKGISNMEDIIADEDLIIHSISSKSTSSQNNAMDVMDKVDSVGDSNDIEVEVDDVKLIVDVGTNAFTSNTLDQDWVQIDYNATNLGVTPSDNQPITTDVLCDVDMNASLSPDVTPIPPCLIPERKKAKTEDPIEYIEVRMQLHGYAEYKSITIALPVDIDHLITDVLHMYDMPISCQVELFIGHDIDEDFIPVIDASIAEALDSYANRLRKSSTRVVDMTMYPIKSFVVQLNITPESSLLYDNHDDEVMANEILVEVDPYLDWESFCLSLMDLHGTVLDPHSLLLDRDRYRLCVLDALNQVEYKDTKSFRNGDHITTRIQEIKQVVIPSLYNQVEALSPTSDDILASPAPSTIHKSSTSISTPPSSSLSPSAPAYRDRIEIAPVEVFSPAKLLDAFECELQDTLAAIGVNLRLDEYKKLKARASTVDGAIEYYFNYSSMFIIADDHSRTASTNDTSSSSSSSLSSSSSSSSSTTTSVRPLPPLLKNCRPYDVALQLWDMAFDERKIYDAMQRCSTLESAIAFLFDDQPMDDDIIPVTYDCPICASDYALDDMYTINCLKNHRVCISCIAYTTKLALLGDNESSIHLPACPFAVKGSDTCGVLDQQEVILFMALAEEKGILQHNDVKLMTASLKRLYHAKLRRENNYIQCVNCPSDPSNDDEGCWFALDGLDAHDRVCVTCPRCKVSFCSQCKVQPYHYQCECEEMVAYARSWREWNANGKEAYMRKAAQDSAIYQNMLQDYESKRAHHDVEVRAAEARYQELMQDEQAKATRCKRCPSCQRVIEKIDGCDSMICGRNYHGGDNQSGCGTTFAWSRALAYTADIGNRRTVNELNVPEPQQAQITEHMIAEGYPLGCDGCRQPIVGPRIKCLNCPSTNICLPCSDRQTNVAGHQKNHTCTVVWTSEHTM